MDKREACHRLADINEIISDLEDRLAEVESGIRCNYDDDERREWYMARKDEIITELDERRREHDDFISEYGDIIYS